jgi:hypothetical protein
MIPWQETAALRNFDPADVCLGHSRHSCHFGVSGSPQERAFGHCPR